MFCLTQALQDQLLNLFVGKYSRYKESPDSVLAISFFRECKNSLKALLVSNLCQSFPTKFFYALITSLKVQLLFFALARQIFNPFLPKQPLILAYDTIGLQSNIKCLSFCQQFRMVFVIEFFTSPIDVLPAASGTFSSRHRDTVLPHVPLPPPEA